VHRDDGARLVVPGRPRVVLLGRHRRRASPSASFAASIICCPRIRPRQGSGRTDAARNRGRAERTPPRPISGGDDRLRTREAKRQAGWSPNMCRQMERSPPMERKTQRNRGNPGFRLFARVALSVTARKERIIRRERERRREDLVREIDRGRGRKEAEEAEGARGKIRWRRGGFVFFEGDRNGDGDRIPCFPRSPPLCRYVARRRSRNHPFRLGPSHLYLPSTLWQARTRGYTNQFFFNIFQRGDQRGDPDFRGAATIRVL
jgi:hypothetical protein